MICKVDVIVKQTLATIDAASVPSSFHSSNLISCNSTLKYNRLEYPMEANNMITDNNR